MPVSDRLRLRWPSPEAASGVDDPSVSEADVVLVGRVAGGDAAALAALYRRHADGLFDAQPVVPTLEDGYVFLAQQHSLTTAGSAA